MPGGGDLLEASPAENVLDRHAGSPRHRPHHRLRLADGILRRELSYRTLSAPLGFPGPAFQMLCGWAGGKVSGPSICTGAPRMSANTMSRPVVHLALELSVTSWLIAYRLPWSDKVRLQRVSAGDGAALLALVSDLREKVAARMGPDVTLASC